MLSMVPCAIDPCHLSILYIVAYISLSQTTCVFFSPLTSGQTVSVKDQIVNSLHRAGCPDSIAATHLCCHIRKASTDNGSG